MSAFERRNKFTNERLAALEHCLLAELGGDRDRLLGTDTAIYVTGSGGRGEMSEHSDVDLFIARTTERQSPVDSFQFHQAVSRTFHALGLPEPSNRGSFLKMHSASSLCGLMGKPVDDTENTLTARMLLLLESAPLASTTTAYDELLTRVLATYWKNREHVADYQPLTLVNDIVRYWRTLLLNYVAKNADKEQAGGLREGDRRYESYKLRFSRCMTCFSMLSYLVALTGTVSSVSEDLVLRAVKTKPVDRLKLVAERQPEAEALVSKLLTLYEAFLDATNSAKADMRSHFEDTSNKTARSQEAQLFGDTMFELLQQLGQTVRGRYLFRHIVV